MKARKIAQAALLIALGVILPPLFHMVGGMGTVFLPMHLPVLLSGFVLGPFWALFIGGVTPILSHLLTGMPPISPPILHLMVPELMAYGLLAGLLFYRLRLHLLLSLVLAMIGGRVVAGLAVFAMLSLFQIPLPFDGPVGFVLGSVVSGAPGILIQLILLPLLYYALKKGGFVSEPARRGGEQS